MHFLRKLEHTNAGSSNNEGIAGCMEYAEFGSGMILTFF